MNPEVALWVGSGAVAGAAVMAAALLWGAQLLRRPASPVETPTAENDPIVSHFNEAMDDLLPLFLPDYRGMPLSEAEQRVIEQIEWDLKYGDPEFRALFEGPTD